MLEAGPLNRGDSNGTRIFGAGSGVERSSFHPGLLYVSVSEDRWKNGIGLTYTKLE